MVACLDAAPPQHHRAAWACGRQATAHEAKHRARILRAIAKARSWMRDLVEGTDALATRETVTQRSVRMTLSLVQLAPRIVTAIVDGRLPRGIGIRDLVDLPASWLEQERALGIV